jgi:NADPH:quinone reductase
MAQQRVAQWTNNAVRKAHPLASRPVRAAVCHELGPPSVLRVQERPDPEPGPGQVTVAVEAAGVNFVDGLFVAGQYQIKPTLPFVPGSEVAGHVVALGPDVSTPALGDRVLASVGLGGYASRVVVASGSAIALPEGMDAPRAATFTQSYSTCLFALRDRAHAAPGDTVLVLGAGGGIGLAAIGVARALGCRVVGVASSADKRQAALDAGAEAVLDPAAEPIKDAVRAWAGGTGVDLVVDPIGGALAEPALRALGDWGRYLVIGFASGEIPSVPLNQILLRNRSVIGIDWGIWAMTHATEQRALLADLLAMVAAGTLDPVRPAEYPLDNVAGALEDLLGRRTVGKIALVP